MAPFNPRAHKDFGLFLVGIMLLRTWDMFQELPRSGLSPETQLRQADVGEVNGRELHPAGRHNMKKMAPSCRQQVIDRASQNGAFCPQVTVPETAGTT